VLDQFEYGPGPGGSAGNASGPPAEPTSLSLRRASRTRTLASDEGGDPQVFVLGGNGSTLAIINSFVPQGGTITARLVPLAFTPVGVRLGDAWQNVGIALAGLLDWVDRTFTLEDDRTFVVPSHGMELLARTGWHAPLPAKLGEDNVLNLDDLPDEIVEAIALPAVAIVQCTACRRLCVRDEFVWKDRQVCAWDYHSQVFGRRGPWRTGPYEPRHFETLPRAAYVAGPLLPELGVETVMLIQAVEEEPARAAIDAVISAEPHRAHLAVRTEDGFTLLRETHDTA
jgi:hypothetical protein